MSDKIWSFDLGKASIGLAVRSKNNTHFDEKESLIIPAELGKRGPSTKSDTPAARYRSWVTRSHRKIRKAWLDELWVKAGQPVPQKKQLLCIGAHCLWPRQGSRALEEDKKRRSVKGRGGKWTVVTEADPILLSEAIADGGIECANSCLLRIFLHRGGLLADGSKMSVRQIYKALYSANRKRGQQAVPWKNDSKRAAQDDAKAKQEADEKAAANRKWQQFIGKAQNAKYQLPCYYDALHLKLWRPSGDEVLVAPHERPESTRQIAFPGERVEAEIFLLASVAAKLLPALDQAAVAWMATYKAEVLARVGNVNAYRQQKGREPMKLPGFNGGATNFAELFTYGPGGKPALGADARALASFDPKLRRELGLRPGHTDDLKAAVGQIVPRFDNRLRQECALLPKCADMEVKAFNKKGFNACRNTTDEDLKRARDAGDQADDAALLPAQVTFLMKLKNLWVAEKFGERRQRKLTPQEVNEVYKARSKDHEYWMRPGMWKKDFCERWSVLPVYAEGKKKAEDKSLASTEEAKASSKNTDYIIEPPNTSGRSRFSRPALRLLKELILSGNKPSEFKQRLLNRESELLAKTKIEVVTVDEWLRKTEPCKHEKTGDDYRVFVKQAESRSYVLEKQLDIFDRMKPEVSKDLKQAESEESWEDMFIPSRRADFELSGTEATPELRKNAIQQLIGSQNNPIVRHRLQSFWDQLIRLEGKHGVPAFVAIELVRDNLENSWLGGKAKDKIKQARDGNESARTNARGKLADLKIRVTERNILRYQLWESQGGECLYGREVKKGQCLYLETGLPISDLESYEVDHIVPRALGGPDAFSNYVLTTKETNERKGDRTPWQWFRDNGFEGWDTYCNRVEARVKVEKKGLGFRKGRLLRSSQAEKLVERYTPLAETAWIARTAMVIANLHFGWTNGYDSNGDMRVYAFTGGLTARVRRQYLLDSLLGASGDLDHQITEALHELNSMGKAGLSDAERQEKELPVREQLEKARKQSEKDRSDQRHHALDAMVLNFLAMQPVVRDSKREEEFRFEVLGDNPCFSSEDAKRVGALRGQIEQSQKAYKKLREQAKADLPADDIRRLGKEMETLQRDITHSRKAISKLWQKRNWYVVREAFRRELHGAADASSTAVLPKHLHYPKSGLDSLFYRGTWIWVEDEKKAEAATIDTYAEAFVVAQKALPLSEFPYLSDRDGRRVFDLRHADRHAQALAPHKDYPDLKAIRRGIRSFIKTKPDEAAWLAWAASAEAPQGIKPKKGESNVPAFKVYKLEEKRTRRQRLFDLGVSSEEVRVWDAGQFELNVKDLVIRPQRPKKGEPPPNDELQPDLELQEKLLGMKDTFAAFFAANPPDPGSQPRQPSARREFEAKKEAWNQSWIAFQKQHGLDKQVCKRLDPDKVTDRPFSTPSLLSVLLSSIKRFDPETAMKQFKGLTDPWTRFQLRAFVRLQPSQSEWKEFCDSFVQVERDELRAFLDAAESRSAADFIKFYSELGAKFQNRSRIEFVQQVMGAPDGYVDVSKDGSGIYAKGGNQGYLIYKKTTLSADGQTEIKFGARAVLGHERIKDARMRLLAETGVTLLDKKLWRTNMLLELPNEAVSGASTTSAGFYYFGSISNEASMTLKPLAGGDTLPGRMVDALLAAGLRRFNYS
jgi:CRISPR-associated endonuclease Csn1